MVKIGAVILAAGESRRMGNPKLFLPLDGKSLITYPVSLAIKSGLEPIVVIGGRHIAKLEDELAPFSPYIQVKANPRYEEGMSSSLQEGIRALADEVDAVLIFLGDQPFVHETVVDTIIKEFMANKEQGIRIVRPLYQQSLGHPILFDGSLFTLFDTLQGDEGGKSIIQAQKEHVQFIDFPNSRWGLDIDTPLDYARLQRKD